MGMVYAADDPEQGRVTYRDRKRFWWSLSVVYPLLPFTGMALHAWTGQQLALGLPLLISYGLMPLRDFPDLPRLPSGYFGMFPLSYVPALWFRVMDPRLLALPHVRGDLAKVNIDPRKRERILARYGLPQASRAYVGSKPLQHAAPARQQSTGENRCFTTCGCS